MRKKRITVFVICITLALAILISAYVFITHYKNSLVIRCNENEITQGLYTMYMITEAAELDRTLYDSDSAFWADLQEIVLDRICIDTYYATMCKQENYTLTGEERLDTEIKMLSLLIALGFDDRQYSNEQAYLDYFNVTRKDFLEFCTRKALYEKYFLTLSGQTKDTYRELMAEYQNFFTRRKETQKKIRAYRESVARLNAGVSKYFNEHRYEYATNYIDVIFMQYPTDENGQVSEAVKNKYSQIAKRAYTALHLGGERKEEGGLYIHEFTTKKPYANYVTGAGKMYVDTSNAMKDIWGEEFIQTCLEGEVNRTYMVSADCGIIVFKVLSVGGEDGCWEELALEVKTKDISNKVRKAILQEDYTPVILNEALYEELQRPGGTFWQNLLENS